MFVPPLMFKIVSLFHLDSCWWGLTAETHPCFHPQKIMRCIYLWVPVFLKIRFSAMSVGVPVAWARASLTPEHGGAVSACNGRTVHSRGSLACAVFASSAPLHLYSLHAGVGLALAPTGSPAAHQRSARSPHTVEQMEKNTQTEYAVTPCYSNWQRERHTVEMCLQSDKCEAGLSKSLS